MSDLVSPYVLRVVHGPVIIHLRSKNETLRGNIMTVTKQTALLEALKKGEELTAKQITSRFGIANPTATISNLRFAGYAVYANEHTDTNGRVTTKYRLGKPSRAVIAAGYRALAQAV